MFHREDYETVENDFDCTNSEGYREYGANKNSTQYPTRRFHLREPIYLMYQPHSLVSKSNGGVYLEPRQKTSKITHTLFVDDLKSYHKNPVKAATIASNLESMFEDIGLHWGGGINKCAAVHVKRGKIVPNEGLPMHSGNQIPVLGEGDYYKFLGKYENATQLE